jgi:hypothetical protein
VEQLSKTALKNIVKISIEVLLFSFKVCYDLVPPSSPKKEKDMLKP